MQVGFRMQIEANARYGALSVRQVETEGAPLREVPAEQRGVSAPASFTHGDDAMRKAMDAQMGSSTAYYQAQLIGQGQLALGAEEVADVVAQPMPSEDGKKVGGGYQTAEEEFLAYMNMTLEERLLAQILKEEGLTKEQFEQLPMEDKRKILAKLKDRLEMTLGIDEQAEAGRRRMGAAGEEMAGGMMSLPDPLFAAL